MLKKPCPDNRLPLLWYMWSSFLRFAAFLTEFWQIFVWLRPFIYLIVQQGVEKHGRNRGCNITPQIYASREIHLLVIVYSPTLWHDVWMTMWKHQTTFNRLFCEALDKLCKNARIVLYRNYQINGSLKEAFTWPTTFSLFPLLFIIHVGETKSHQELIINLRKGNWQTLQN